MLSAHRRAQAEGGELRIVVPACGPVPRTFALICLDRVIPCTAAKPKVSQALDATMSIIVVLLNFVPIITWRPAP